MFDLRQVVTQFVGMPLGSQYVKDHVKESNYYLFYGPPGSGKTHIVPLMLIQGSRPLNGVQRSCPGPFAFDHRE